MVIRALVFDAYGTLYDVQSVRSLATDLCGDKGEIVTLLWRLKQLEYTWLRSLMRSYEDFWSVTRAAMTLPESSPAIPPRSIPAKAAPACLYAIRATVKAIWPARSSPRMAICPIGWTPM